jgi:hypothetical protein
VVKSDFPVGGKIKKIIPQGKHSLPEQIECVVSIQPVIRHPQNKDGYQPKEVIQ